MADSSNPSIRGRDTSIYPKAGTDWKAVTAAMQTDLGGGGKAAWSTEAAPFPDCSRTINKHPHGFK